jgi:hypothetical protein
MFGIFDSFTKIKDIWNDYGFTIILVLCVLFILIFAFFRFCMGKKGTWDKGTDQYQDFFFMGSQGSQGYKKKRNGPPQESKGEIECKRVLEKFFNKSFNKYRPDFLRNEVTGGVCNLEIDCYNHELRLGVEYQGQQHYKYIPYFHKNKEAFMNQKYRDELKRRMCKDNGIIVIEVPYTVDIPDIKEFLRREINRYGFKI